MRRRFLLGAGLVGVLWALLLIAPVHARQRIAGFCEDGGQSVLVQGLTSTTKVQRSYAACTVTVYPAGASQVPANLAIIYSDDNGTQQTNPFTAAADGQWFFYADTGRYDVRFSGAGITTPFTRGDQSTGGMLNVYPLNQLPLPGNEGALVRLSNSTRGLYLDTGNQWTSLLGNVTNVMDFNAHGNGLADDTAAIQNAVNALPTNIGGEVLFPCGTYKISAPITLQSNTILHGSGACSILAITGDVHGITATGTSATQKSFIWIHDFAIQKTSGSVTSNGAIRFDWIRDGRIERVYVTNNGGVWGSAFLCGDCSRVQIIDSQGRSTGSNVLVFANTSGTVSTTNGINNAVIGGVYSTNFQGISMGSQTDFLLDHVVSSGSTSTFGDGFIIESNTKRGVIRDCVALNHIWDGYDFEPLGSSYDVVVVGNTASGNTRQGFNVQTGGGMFIGNIATSNGGQGIIVTGGLDTILLGNTLRSNDNGIYLVDSFTTTVMANKFTANTTAGLHFSGSQSNNVVIGNLYAANGANWLGMTAGDAVAGIDFGPSTMRGAITISGASASGSVTTIGMPDTNYIPILTVKATTGAPAAGATRVSAAIVSNTQFTVNLEAAPGGVATVTVGWVLVR